ncbi:MAG: endo-1,4-beta-xylanase [Ignavibacteriaceae bacterium]
MQASYYLQHFKHEQRYLCSLNKLSFYKIFIIFIFILCYVFTSQSFSQPLANGKSKFVGNILNSGTNIPSYFTKYWNQITPGNAGKWGSVEYDTGSYSWTQLDNIYNFSISHDYPFKEHNLIWNTQQPAFMTNGSLDSIQEYQEIVNWIDTCGKRYPNAALCDVVNEPIDHAPAYKNVLGGNGSTGWDWIIKAFELAREYWSPNTKLLLNEYNVINNASRNAIYLQIINLLKARGLIDGIGVQAHSFEVDGPSVSSLKANLDRLTATGLPVYISEFSINEADDNTQLQKYMSIFPMLYEDPGVKGITLWGYVEYDMWSAEPNAYLVTDRLVERPAIQWLRSYLSSYLLSQLISPIDTTPEPRNPLLVWHISTAATSYHVQVATDSSFVSTIVDSTVADTLMQLDTLSSNTKYYWHVYSLNPGDTGTYSPTSNFTTGDQILGIIASKEIPQKFVLSQNYPNPFNPTTVIRYSIPQSGLVTLNVYNLLGQKISALVNKEQSAGSYEVKFDASILPSGIYLYRIEEGKYSQIKKMILLK